MAEYKEYVCTLDEKSLKRAKEELNENPADRMNSVVSFRKLIQTRAPHLICSLGKQLDKTMVLSAWFLALKVRSHGEVFWVCDCDLFTCDFMQLFIRCDGCGCDLLCICIGIEHCNRKPIHVRHRTQKCIAHRADRTM